jgi:hypothetical protein
VGSIKESDGSFDAATGNTFAEHCFLVMDITQCVLAPEHGPCRYLGFATRFHFQLSLKSLRLVGRVRVQWSYSIVAKTLPIRLKLSPSIYPTIRPICSHCSNLTAPLYVVRIQVLVR